MHNVKLELAKAFLDMTHNPKHPVCLKVVRFCHQVFQVVVIFLKSKFK